MDYEGEFYKLMKKKEDEIKALDIPEERKLKLFFYASKNIQEYEQNKLTSKVYQTLKRLEKMVSGAMIKLSNAKKISKNQKENQNLLPFPGYMPLTLPPMADFCMN